MRAGLATPPLCTLRYFAAQVAGFNYDDEDLEGEHIPAAYVRSFQVAMRADLLRCLTLSVSVEREAYGHVPILPTAIVRLMIL